MTEKEKGKGKASANTPERAKPKLSPREIEPRYQEHLRRVEGPAKVGGK